MTAEYLRETAALIRERATAAAASGAQWTGQHYWVADYDPSDPTGQTAMQRLVGGMDAPDCDHYSSWPPAVALAVADLLEADARLMEQTAFADANWEAAKSFAVARAYRGES